MTKIAQKLLVKKHHDKKDGELILTGQLKPFSNTSSQEQVTIVPFCCVQECKEQACFSCSDRNDKCRDKSFCCMHGPEHEQHQSQFFKTPHEMIQQEDQYNEQLLSTALLRVRDKVDKNKEKDKMKKKQVKKRIQELQAVVEETFEATSLVTRDKLKKREKVKRKNQTMLDHVDKRLHKKARKRNSSTEGNGQISANVMIDARSTQTNHPSFNAEINISLSSGDQQSTSRDLFNTAIDARATNLDPSIHTDLQSSNSGIDTNSVTLDPSMHTNLQSSNAEINAINLDPSIQTDVQSSNAEIDARSTGLEVDAISLSLKRTVDHLIEVANDNGKSRRAINFDICMEESLNISYYKQHLKNLLHMYHIPLNPTNWIALSNTDFEENKKDHKTRRSRFITAFCDSLRLLKIVTVDKVESRLK